MLKQLTSLFVNASNDTKRQVGALYFVSSSKIIIIFQNHMAMDKIATSLLEIMGPAFCAAAEYPSGTNVGMMF